MARVECPQCGGYGHTGIEEETGCPFSCYLCGESGWVDAAVADSIRREEELYRDRANSLAANVIRCRYDPEGYDGCYADHSALFTRLVPGSRPPSVWPMDDIPF